MAFSLHQRTPLHVAARRGHVHTVGYLVDKGADINIRDRYLVSLLTICADLII